MTRTGGQLVVEALEREGVDFAFGVPGESYLPALDALRDSPVEFVVCRHEAAAASMAEAYGKLTGRPGVCLVTRGPGATHASIGVHVACQDSTPLVLLVGQVPRAHRGREAFQELDYRSVFGTMAKAVDEVEGAASIPRAMAEAFAEAASGRPGPVVLALPEDVLAERAEPAAVPVARTDATPTDSDLVRLRELLAAAERPLVVVGEGGWTAQTGADVLAYCEASELPVCASFRCQDFVDNRSPCYVGHLTLGLDPKLGERVRAADVIVAVGGRLGEITTHGYTLLEPPRPRQTLVHVHPDPGELGRVYEPTLAIPSALPAFAERLRGLEPVDSSAWREWTAAARADYLANLRPGPMPGDVDLGEIVARLRRRLPDDAIVTCGAGNFTVWVHRFYEFRRFGTLLAPRAGAMGYGLPAALAAQLVHRERIVVCVAGDGDFLMSAQELATAAKYELPVVVLVVDNGMYGTIRMHQERLFPGRVSGTELVNPDFAAFARSFGAHGATVTRTDEFADAFEAALAARRPAVIALRVDPEAITPRATLSELRASALG